MSTKSSLLSRSWLNILADRAEYAVMFTSRGDTGDAADPYSAFSLCHYTGDTPRHVAQCREMLAATLGIDVSCIIVPRQTHSTRVVTIDALPVRDAAIEGADGVVTTLRDVAVGVSTADCVPVIAVDSVAGVAGAFHAGWRGAVGGVVGFGIEAMTAAGALAGRIEVYIGPSICCSCFEVGEEVAAFFPEEFVVRKEEWPKPHVDLPAYVESRLVKAGVAAGNIRGFAGEMCTRCHPDKYFSARAAGIASGRNFTFAILR